MLNLRAKVITTSRSRLNTDYTTFEILIDADSEKKHFIITGFPMNWTSANPRAFFILDKITLQSISNGNEVGIILGRNRCIKCPCFTILIYVRKAENILALFPSSYGHTLGHGQPNFPSTDVAVKVGLNRDDLSRTQFVLFNLEIVNVQIVSCKEATRHQQRG